MPPASVAVFQVPLQGQTISVQARSEFEARMWAVSMASVDKTLCQFRQYRRIHLGPICSACDCYLETEASLMEKALKYLEGVSFGQAV